MAKIKYETQLENKLEESCNRILNFSKVTLVLTAISMSSLMGLGMSIDKYKRLIKYSSDQVEIVNYKNRIEDFKKIAFGDGIATGISFLGFAASSFYWKKKHKNLVDLRDY